MANLDTEAILHQFMESQLKMVGMFDTQSQRQREFREFHDKFESKLDARFNIIDKKFDSLMLAVKTLADNVNKLNVDKIRSR